MTVSAISVRCARREFARRAHRLIGLRCVFRIDGGDARVYCAYCKECMSLE